MFSKAFILAAVAAFTTSVAAKSGDMTFFNPGLGACGGTDNDGSPVVALNPVDYANGANCGRWITIQGNGHQTAARVVDLCPGCSNGDIDVSPAIFDDIAPLDVGRTRVNWFFQ
ncbi:RlpA-like double-psi beta-barrel-protein domain-containing protein-containing protein [Xylaria bambusicola]|uniref:RlpA-like double-psi beta-barrel-protein domain-containing protein-containing protein n=1 Tax=Xylaria bambusicola TaxID=326684 RepID=UPI0020085085|nr:RlpA-like double-psi beta-barrel-protein domain-containing protein-containing protein [Xylaria bambusicola]KAI0508469.1 RlpA-like double-psi beta-barrel-protein domain-containing protein-containing protein [Xylaria bambusicola]